MRLSEALQKYIAFGKYKNKAASMETYRTHIRLLCVHFRNCDIEDIKSHDIIQYMDLMKEMGWDENTFNTKANAWKQFFKYWKEEGLDVLSPNNIPVPKVERKQPRSLTDEELTKLLDVLENHPKNIITLRNKTALRMLADCGARLNEFLSIKVSDIDLNKRETIIKTEKKPGSVKALRAVFWTKETHRYLTDYLKARKFYLEEQTYADNGNLWITANGRWQAGNTWKAHALETLLKRLSFAANLGWTAHPHSFRHRFGRKLALGPKGDGSGGANAYVLKDMLGHADVRSSEIYTVLNEESMRNVHEKFFKKG
jgi:integrase/recombinase XerD